MVNGQIKGFYHDLTKTLKIYKFKNEVKGPKQEVMVLQQI